MKTTYSRTFFGAMIVLLAALTAVGIFLRALLQDYLTDAAFDRLDVVSKVLSELAGSYQTEGTMNTMELLVDLDIAGDVSGVDALICDSQGNIILCSDAAPQCAHQGQAVNLDFYRRVAKGERVCETGMIQGLYSNSRYVCARPIYSDGQVVGMVVVSQPESSTEMVLSKMTEIYITVSCLVVLVSVLLIGWFVNRQFAPLKQMAKTARAFGHGDLDARVEMRGGYPLEVEELALAFNNMASSLQKGEYQRQEFVANVSHELKTPMTTIGGYIDGILDGTIPPERSRHYMQIVSDETKRLSRLVRSMLDISQLQTESGIPEEKKTRFDLGEVAGQVLITFEQKILSKGVEVEVELPEHPVFTMAERDYVTQVIYNLLDNAVKFCPTGGTLGLRIREDLRKAYISVYNDGKTIPPEELPLVFDRFHKIDKSRSENRDGWGLGLYIVKTIICAHGENISVTSRDGRTEFTFTMPMVI